MARAKTTDRAEARRRYRAQLAEVEAATTGEEPVPGTLPGTLPGAAVPTAPTTTRSVPKSGAPPARAAGRPSVLAVLRAASGPADVAGDLRALPWIVRHTKAVWLPAVVIVGTGLAFMVPAVAENPIVRFLGLALLAPPPMIPAFLAGMLTRRGSWLVGGIAGFLAGLVVTLLVTVSPSTTSTTAGLDISNLGYLLVAGPIFAMGVGAFAGFYRRFLALSAPQRQQARRTAQASKSAKRR